MRTNNLEGHKSDCQQGQLQVVQGCLGSEAQVAILVSAYEGRKSGLWWVCWVHERVGEASSAIGLHTQSLQRHNWLKPGTIEAALPRGHSRAVGSGAG